MAEAQFGLGLGFRVLGIRVFGFPWGLGFFGFRNVYFFCWSLWVLRAWAWSWGAFGFSLNPKALKPETRFSVSPVWGGGRFRALRKRTPEARCCCHKRRVNRHWYSNYLATFVGKTWTAVVAVFWCRLCFCQCDNIYYT